jgi:cyanobactin maturation PatA/PatG family protease
MTSDQNSYYEREYAQLPTLQQLGRFGSGMHVAVIDGLIDLHHPYLQDVQVSQVPGPETPPTQHGTAVASQIVGKTIGIAPQSALTSVPVFQEGPTGGLQGCSELSLARAIGQASAAGAEIINISGSSLSPNGNGTQELRQAIRKCTEKGTLVVAAVGNDARASESVPASIEGVFAVAAHDDNGQPALFNNFGSKLRAKAILAPGVNVPAAALGGEYALITGTSFAAPIVTGVLALTLAALRRTAPDASPQDAANLLLETALPCQTSDGKTADQHMAGRLDINALISLLVGRYPSLSALSTNPKKRITPMSDLQDAPLEVEPAAAPKEGSAEASVTPAEDTPIAVEPAETTENAIKEAGLDLPKIADPAANTHVHAAPQAAVQPQAAKVQPAVMDEKVFAIGEIGYDFGTEARLDYFTQVMDGEDNHPFDPVHMSRHLTADNNVEQSNALIWTLKIDGIPVYAIEPENQFAVLQYARLVQFLHDQEKDGVERVSIAGHLTGETRLFNGQIIPKFSPVLRGMYNWKSKELAEAVMSASGDEGGADATATTSAIEGFLNRVYYELRNRGASSPERALNYAATNAFQIKEVFDDAFAENLFLNKISTEESPVSRPESDCWDVVLEFFNPKERLTAARKLYRYTVDVSDVMPVTVGDLRSWHAY